MEQFQIENEREEEVQLKVDATCSVKFSDCCSQLKNFCCSPLTLLTQDASPDVRRLVVVPELYYWWAQLNFPCIPKPLYKNLVRELLPVGTERAKIFIKVVFMGVFVYYVITITDVLGMGDDDDSLFDLAKFVVTVLAVGMPSFIGNFQSDKVKEIKVLHKKGIIREEIERFLSRNKEFYDYKKGLDQLGVIVGEEGVVRQPVADDDDAGG